MKQKGKMPALRLAEMKVCDEAKLMHQKKKRKKTRRMRKTARVYFSKQALTESE